jgi:rhamnose utilization protein RhaD (predicted bifunctional aldolase and dehydrogenase)
MRNNHFNAVVEALGSRQEYFPGTGGNISLKLEDGTMLIKASGKRIIHMNEDDGVVALSYKDIKDYFHATLPSEEGEKESGELIQFSTHKNSAGRPSIETGFHTLLSQAVIHSHSAYVNMLTCSTSFETLVDTLFLGTPISYLCISYAKPGYYLTHLFLDKVRRISAKPKVIFMENHGIVVTASTLEDAILLHEEVNARIKNYFGFKGTEYPQGVLTHTSDTQSISKTPLLSDFISNNIEIFENINDHILFPDLTVFCQDIMVTDDSSVTAKICINKKSGEIIYNTTKKEAHCIEENLIAFAFLSVYMKEHNLTPVYISEEEADSIRNMEQEKYRKRLLER